MHLFKNTRHVFVLFFLLLSLDVFFKLNDNLLLGRFFSKPMLLITLIFYFVNGRLFKSKKDFYFLLALTMFLLGDFFLLLHEIKTLYIVGILLFMIGKLLYVKRFSNQNDFSIAGLIPIFSAIFIYIIVIILVVFDNLGDFFFPILAYLFSAMLLLLFAYLRKNTVSKYSFLFVIIGVFLSIGSDSLTLLKSFYDVNFGYNKITIMLFYGASQLFIVHGLVLESRERLTTILN